MKLNPAVIKGFTESLLAARYDNPKAVPKFHEELWALCCSDHPRVAIAAPRRHAKSTAITFAYVLANIMFRIKRHVLIISSNEELAMGFLGNIKTQLLENDALRETFGFLKLIKDSESEIIGQFQDGSKFRIIAKGSNQRMRGMLWDLKRPDLVVGDDMEDDEIVMNKQRRLDFKRWFYGAVLPIVADDGVVRIVGTILHMDSLLEGFMPDLKDDKTVITGTKVRSLKVNKPWLSVKYRAHDTINPATSTTILWPEQWPKDRLVSEYDSYAVQNLLDVYAQEYLNDPIDESSAFFKEENFMESPQHDEWLKRHKRYYAAVDLAITQEARSDYTAIVVGAHDSEGRLEIIHARKGHWDTNDIVENILEVQKRYSPDIFSIEKGALEKAIGPYLELQMRTKGTYVNLNPIAPTKDKEARARSIQGRMKNGDVYFVKQAPWYPDFAEELKRFPRAKHDDYVDAFSYLGLALNQMIPAPTPEEFEEERRAERRAAVEHALSSMWEGQTPTGGRNSTTGY